MTPRDLIDDLRSRINPAYAAQLGTESYERRLCAEALEAQADEIDALRATMVDLLEILRQWEPDHSSGEHRRRIVLAMYQIGVLHDPTATVAAMQTQNVELTGLRRSYGEGPVERRVRPLAAKKGRGS